MPRFTLDELARLTGGRLAGDPAREITGAAPPHTAGLCDVTFVFAQKALAVFLASKAGAAIVPEGCDAAGRDVIHHRNPQAAMPAVLEALYPERRPAPGVHGTAVVHGSANVGARVHVGPHAVVDEDAVLADDVIVGAGSHVGRGSVVGERTRLHPHVVLYPDVRLGRDCVLHSGVVIGADGFGFVRAGGSHRKIPQVAGVVIGDDVEIGANSCVDRGTLTPTRIGTNTKIDNLVQIGHNCEIGDRVIVCGQAAIAGSTIIEDDVVLAGQVGATGHLRVGRGSIAAAGTGITGDVDPGARIAGHPPMPLQEWRRVQATYRRLPDMRSELRDLRKRLAALESHIRATNDAG
jgi:UDP-3-O-[3-hydroxymyristoyl] glucosamine N-acyltransferase